MRDAYEELDSSDTDWFITDMPLDPSAAVVRVVECSFFFSSRRRHTRCSRDWSSDVCSSDLTGWSGDWPPASRIWTNRPLWRAALWIALTSSSGARWYEQEQDTSSPSSASSPDRKSVV